MPRDRRAAQPWPSPRPERTDTAEPEQKWSSLTDTGSMEPSPEALAWQRRADAWAQQAESDQSRAVEPASRWSEVASTGRTTFPADGVGWRTETAEWRATGARWRQTTEWRSTTGSHGWRSTTEAWQTGGNRAGDPPADTPTSQPALSSTAWSPTGSDPLAPTSSSDATEARPSWQQFTSQSTPWQESTPSWQQPAPRQPADSSQTWQHLVDPSASAERPSWAANSRPSWQRDAIDGTATWTDLSSDGRSAAGPAGGASRGPDATAGWPRPDPAAERPSWQTPRDDGRHMVREDDRAAWRRDTDLSGGSPQVGRRRAPEGGARSAGTGWAARSDADNWAGHTDTGNIPLYPDPSTTTSSSWRDTTGRHDGTDGRTVLPMTPYGDTGQRAGRHDGAGQHTDPATARSSPFADPTGPAAPYGRAANPTSSYGGAATPTGPYGGAAGPYGGAASPAGPYGGAASPASPYGGAATPTSPYGGAAPTSPYGGAPAAGQFGAAPASGPYGGAPPTGPYGGAASPISSYGGAAPASPYGGAASTPGPYGGAPPTGPYGGAAPTGPYGGATTPTSSYGGAAAGGAAAAGPYGATNGRPGPYGDTNGRPGPYGEPAGQANPYGDADGRPGPYGDTNGRPGPYGEPAGQANPYGEAAARSTAFGESASRSIPYGDPAARPARYGEPPAPYGEPRPNPYDEPTLRPGSFDDPTMRTTAYDDSAVRSRHDEGGRRTRHDEEPGRRSRRDDSGRLALPLTDFGSRSVGGAAAVPLPIQPTGHAAEAPPAPRRNRYAEEPPERGFTGGVPYPVAEPPAADPTTGFGRRRRRDEPEMPPPAPERPGPARFADDPRPGPGTTQTGGRRGRDEEAARPSARSRARYNEVDDDWREHTGTWAAEPDTSSWVRDPDTGQWSRAQDDPRVQAWREEAARREPPGREATGRRELTSGREDTGQRPRRLRDEDDEPRGGSGFSGPAPRSAMPYGPAPTSAVPDGPARGGTSYGTPRRELPSGRGHLDDDRGPARPRGAFGSAPVSDPPYGSPTRDDDYGGRGDGGAYGGRGGGPFVGGGVEADDRSRAADDDAPVGRARPEGAAFGSARVEEPAVGRARGESIFGAGRGEIDDDTRPSRARREADDDVDQDARPSRARRDIDDDVRPGRGRGESIFIAAGDENDDARPGRARGKAYGSASVSSVPTSGVAARSAIPYGDGPGVSPRSGVPSDDESRGGGRRRAAEEPPAGRRRALSDRPHADEPVGPEIWGREPGRPKRQLGLGEGKPSWSLDDPSTESRQRLEPGSWHTAEREAAARGAASYREGGGGDWRRDLTDQSNLVEGEARRFGTSDFAPFAASGSAAVPRPSNLSLTSTSLISPVRERESLLRPQRSGNGLLSPSGAYERRPVTGSYPTIRRNDLLDPDDEEDEDTGGPLAAIGYTVIWYGVPVVLFVLYMLLVNTGSQTHALDTLASAAPQFGVSLVLSVGVAVGLRKVSTSWKAISVGLASAVVGGGLATVLASAITGNSLS
jgi:hypothetical protein